MHRARVVLILSLCVPALATQSAAQGAGAPPRISIIGIGGHRPGVASQAAAMLDSTLRHAKIEGVTLLPAAELEQYLRDFAYVGWNNDLPENDLVTLSRILRLDALLELRLDVRGDSTIAHLRLLDVKQREWIGMRRTRGHVEFRESIRALRPVADSLVRAFAHIY
jgi:hypothetical protein